MNKEVMRKRINEVIKTDATVVELQDFMATHVPFKRLKYYNSGIETINGKELGEEEFFYEFIENTRDKHNFIVIQGDNGSGKSHFIKWIKNKIESEEVFPEDVVIFLERSQNTLQGTINQLINNEVISGFLSEEEKIKLKNTGIELSEERFISMINYNFIIEVENEEDEETLKLRERERIVEFLKDNLVQKQILFREDGPIKRIANKLINSQNNSINEEDIRFKEEDFDISIDMLNSLEESDANQKAIKFAEALEGNRREIRSKVSEYLNSKIDTVIQRTIKLNATDLNSILEKIRKKLKELNKNLVFFIEDITSFTGIDKGVIESLIVEHREDNGLCRLFSIIGVTTGYYQFYFPDNLKDRVTGRIFIDSNSLFDDKRDVLELAARYINAINIDKDELKKWISLGSSDINLPIKDSNKEWDSYIDNNGRKFSLYPLTENAILNLYYQIREKATPRRFIKNVLLPVLNHFANDKKFPEGILEFESELLIPKLANELLNRRIDSEINDPYENSRTKCLLRIWGDGTIDTHNDNGIKYIGNIDERIFDEFNVIKIEGNKINKVKSESNFINDTNKEISEKDEKRKIDISHKERDEHEKDNSVRSRVENDDFKLIEEYQLKEKGNNIPKKIKIYNDIQDELNTWFKENKNLKIHSKIREEIINLILNFINWDIEEVPLYLAREAINKNNVKIVDQQLGEERGSNIIWIEKTEEDYYFLLSLMKYSIIGEKRWDYEGAQDDIILITKWIENNKKRIVNYAKNLGDTDYNIYDYAISADIYSYIINKDKGKGKQIKLSDIHISEIYDILTDELKVKEKNDLEQLLGNKYTINYLDKKQEVEDNHRFVIESINCPLGMGKSIFLDAIEMIKAIERVKDKEYEVDNFENVKFISNKEFWRKPYDLLKGIYGKSLENALSEVKDKIFINDKDYLNSFNDIGIINKLFSVLEDKNIHYPGYIKSDFTSNFGDLVSYNEYEENRNILRGFNNFSKIDKIYLLQSDTPTKFKKCNEILKNIEDLIFKKEEEYKNRSISNNISSEDIENIKENCILVVDNMEKDVKLIEEKLK